MQCLYSVKSCSRPCSRQLANYTKQLLGHNIDICNAKHGAKQHVYTSSTTVNSSTSEARLILTARINFCLNYTALALGQTELCFYPSQCVEVSLSLLVLGSNFSQHQQDKRLRVQVSFALVFPCLQHTFFGGGLCTGQVITPREVFA